eukprot:449234-Pleurochrysis_carterae.AAC.1
MCDFAWSPVGVQPVYEGYVAFCFMHFLAMYGAIQICPRARGGAKDDSASDSDADAQIDRALNGSDA